MGIISWVIVGGIAGWIASKFTGNDAKMGVLANVISGVIGAFVGGLILNLLGIDGITGLNIWSIIVATVGAIIVLFIANKVSS